MAKKKSKRNGRPAPAASNNGSNPGSSTPPKRSISLAGAGSAILIAIATSYAISSWSGIKNPTVTTQKPKPPAIQADKHQTKKDAFLKWFVDNGGTFHPIALDGDRTVNVTIEEFPSYGGWGLALPVFDSDESDVDDDECKQSTTGNNDEQQCTIAENEKKKSPIIQHLQPLFTVPSSIIISIPSIFDTYTSNSSPNFLPNFYPKVNKILTKAFPNNNDGSNNNNGLAKHGMGLVQQDVVIAMYLMVEECQHKNTQLLFPTNKNNAEAEDTSSSSRSSRWGPYLDVLPQYTIPRLDTFGDEAYAALKDEQLEYTGRQSKRLLEQMYLGSSGGDNTNDDDIGLSLKAVVNEMIHKRIEMLSALSSSSQQQKQLLSIPESCVSFDTFHRFVGIVSSRAMVLRGEKHLTPLAEMINYAPKVESQQHELIRTPFDLYHTLSEDNSITVRSDRDVFSSDASDGSTFIQIFEDYGPVDSSLFLEAHGFLPYKNPNNCATIPGSFFLRRSVAAGRKDENAHLVLRALKSLYLIHPATERFGTLEDVCVKENLELVDDGNTVGRKPASDSIAIASLLLGEGGHWNQMRILELYKVSFENLREKCIAAVQSGDAARMELRCARYPGNDLVVKSVLRTGAFRAGTKFGYDDQVESHDNHQLTLALRFRAEERRILLKVASSEDRAGMRPLPNVASSEDGPEVQDGNELEHEITDPFGGRQVLEQKVVAFNSFIESLNLPLNKLEARVVGDGMRLGAFATDDLGVDDAYISLPPSSVIDINTALANVDKESEFADLLRKYARLNNAGQNDGFEVLLVYLLHERFVLKEQSRWWAYLDLLPTIEEMSDYHPLFFSEEEIDRYLAGSDVRQFILRYQHRAAERHKTLSSDLDANVVLGSDILLDKRKFLWATALLDSRSIWWDNTRHLTPLLDLVNADVVGRVHETKIEDSIDMTQKLAVTRASRPFQAGEQIFEHYGQPNYLLFSYHGFVLEENPSDCALLQGLFISRNDPGAKHAHRLRSTTPTFCIKDKASIEELAQFLRVKHGLSAENSASSVIDDGVRPYLIDVLNERIARLIDARQSQNVMSVSLSRLQFMRKMAELDLEHFQYALNNHVLSSIRTKED